MDFDPADVRASVFYQQMIHCIVPRPIAWVSTVSETGVTNVAPFSYFTGVGSRPPSLLFCPANNRDGKPKDTLRNILDTGEFVVNIVPFAAAKAMNDSAAALPPEESEFDVGGLTPLSSVKISAPRVSESPVQFECRKIHVLNIGNQVFGGSGQICLQPRSRVRYGNNLSSRLRTTKINLVRINNEIFRHYGRPARAHQHAEENERCCGAAFMHGLSPEAG